MRKRYERDELDPEVAAEWTMTIEERASMSRLFCFGLGYCAAELGRRLLPQGWTVAGTTAHPEKMHAIGGPGLRAISVRGRYRASDVAGALKAATHVLLSIPPDAESDPALAQFGDEIAGSPSVRWIGYFSTVGVYGDANGGWVDETTEPRPGTERGQRRLKAENGWIDLARRSGKTLVIYRLPGILRAGPQRHRSA